MILNTRFNLPVALFLFVTFAAIFALGEALILEHMFGYAPCALCLQQRWGYYIAIPLSLAALVFYHFKKVRFVLLVAMLGAAGLYLWSGGISVYHAGVEWDLWAGPTSCTPLGNADFSGSILDAIQSVQIVPCDEPALTILGLSLAAWNALFTFAFAATLFYASHRLWRQASSSASQ